MKHPILFFVIPVTALVVTSCNREEPPQPATLPRPVKVATLHNGGLAKIVEFPGQIASVQQSRKAFDVPGRVTEMPVMEGQEITKGQVLAQLDQTDYKAALESAEARLAMAQSQVNRMTPLVAKGAISEQQMDLANRDLITATSARDQAKKAFDDTTLRADFDGQVAELLVKDFANVQAKQDIMVIHDVSSLEIVIQVPETVVALQMPGATDEEKVARAKPIVIPSTLPDEQFPAVYREVSRTPDPVTRTYKLTLSFTPPAESRVRAGMTAKVRASIPANASQSTKGFPVPMAAVMADNTGRGQVWKLDPDTMTVSRVPVDLGAAIGENILVTGEVATGDLVVTSGVHQLREGQKVRIWEQH